MAAAAPAVAGLVTEASTHVTVGADDVVATTPARTADTVLTFRVRMRTTTTTTFSPPITTDDGTVTERASQVVRTASTPPLPSRPADSTPPRSWSGR